VTTPGPRHGGKRFTGTPAGRRTLRLGDFFSAKRSAEVSSFFVPHPQNRHPGRGRLRRFHLGKGRESQQRIRTFPKGSACGTPATAPFPGSDAPPLPANVPVWEGCRVAGAPPPLPGRSDPETPRYPPATIRSDTGRRCALSGGVPLLLPRFSVLYSPKDHPAVQTCARQGTCRQTSHPVFSWKNGMKTCEFFVVIL